MGFVLFGEAGTFEFKPTDYGLVPGDQCIVFCVGGGGGGGGSVSSLHMGASGETTSFGSVLSALGGAGGSLTSQPNEPTGGSLGGTNRGGGGGGWYPGAPITGGSGISGNVTDLIAVAVSRTCGGCCGAVQGLTTMGGGGAAGGKGSINGVGAEGGEPTGNGSATVYGGGGGAGYGAGGGAAGTNTTPIFNGGNGGEVKMTNYTIPNTADTVLITVGDGGQGGLGQNGGAGGNGCCGCVCIVW